MKYYRPEAIFLKRETIKSFYHKTRGQGIHCLENTGLVCAENIRLSKLLKSIISKKVSRKNGKEIRK